MLHGPYPVEVGEQNRTRYVGLRRVIRMEQIGHETDAERRCDVSLKRPHDEESEYCIRRRAHIFLAARHF